MRMRAHPVVSGAVWLLTFAGVWIGQPSIGYAQPEVLASIDRREASIRVFRGVESSVELEIAALGRSPVRVPLNERWTHVADVRISPSSTHVCIVGDIGIARVIVADLRTGKVVQALSVRKATLSPDGRFVAIEGLRGARQSLAYGVLATERSEAGLVQIYPRDQSNHAPRSDFFWLSPNTVVFLDLNGDRVSLVATELAPTGQVLRTVAKPLDTEALVNTAQIDTHAAPASAIMGPTISRLDQPGLVARLKFPNTPSLRKIRIDVPIW